MNCRNHPDRTATAVCRKLGIGFCAECCECRDAVACCGCRDPGVYCQFRTECLVWELSRERRRRAGSGGTLAPGGVS